AQDDPARSGGWNTEPPQDPARSGGWPAGQQQDNPNRSGGWTAGQQQDDPNRSGGWAGTGQRDEQPEWAPADQAAPAWSAPEPAARGAARVPQAAPAPQPWPAQDDPARSGGWNTEPPQDPARSGGWPAGQQQDDQARAGGWAEDAAPADRPQHDDPNRSGGWAGTGQQDDQSPAGWNAGAEQRPGGSWGAPQDDQPQGDEWPGRDESARVRGAASVPQQPEERDANGWGSAEPAPTPPGRAAVPVPGDGGPPAWGNAAESLPQRTANPVAPDVEPWSADEAWGRAEAGEPAASRAGTGWEADRAEEPPIYQPAPGPGISPANAVPLPPQEQRVPGASLAAAPPADYVPPAPFAPEQSAREGGLPAYEQEQPSWAQAGSRHDEPQATAGPMVPAPRTSPESGGRAAVPAPEGAEAAAGSVSASAAVPLASRVMPPTDQALRPGGTPAPQPRVYGRPARPEPADEPEQDEPNGHRLDHAPSPRFDQAPETRFDHAPDNRFDQGPDNRFDQGPEPRFDDRDRGPAAFGGAAPVAPASPAAPPAFPPGVPSFADAPASDRPVNGVRPHGGADRPAEHFGAPSAGGAVGAAAGYGPAPMPEPAPGNAFPPAFPPPGQQPGQQPGPSWGQGGQGDPGDQGRFDSFKPIAEPKTEAPTPKVRNGRVLAAVLVAAVLILAVPLGLLMLLGKVGGAEETPAFDPAVGSCVKQSGEGAAAANCGEAGAFTVVSKVDAKDKCADPAQPHVVLPGDGANRVLCLKPAGK
ncbi:LppU/SCO3897 family protein, partial [Micromonospora sp. URMC 106]|uniref:LppU/SCO3897 family protein n=1 Tax=Micromonospora sp. URMC 106 TaxID=3423408 RepID=UPI003F1DDDB9